jgi:multiple sugar transport system permease protein
MKTNVGWKIVGVVVLALLLVWTLVPFYWMAITSFKPNKEMYTAEPTLWPTRFVLDHYYDIFVRKGFPLFLRNSAIITTVTTVASLAFGGLAAYALTRLNFLGRRMAGVGLIISYVVPASVIFIPLYNLLRSIGLVDTLLGLILADLTLTIPFCTWLLVGYFKTIPKELEEAALMDGCGRVGTLLRIIIPLSAPAVAVVALFSFTLAWNEFLYAVVFSGSKEVMPLTAGLASLRGEDILFWGDIMAMSLLMAIPPVALYLIAQRWVIGGLVIGGVKG